jgi:hypothetical protein
LPVTPQGVSTLPSVSVDPYQDAILRGIQ